MPTRTPKRTSKWKVPLFFAGGITIVYLICSFTGVLEFYDIDS